MGKNLILDPILTHLAQIWGSQIVQWNLALLVVRHCSMLWKLMNKRKLKRKLINQTWGNGKKPTFEPDWSFGLPKLFTWVLPLLNVRHCCKLWLYAISRKTMEPNLRTWQKKLILGSILARFAQIWVQRFFFVSLALLDVRQELTS